MSKLIFLDTNVYLHYQDFDQIDWLDVMHSDAVTIIIPPMSIRELNKVKETHPRARQRKRAGATLKKLDALLASNHTIELRDGISLRLEDRDPLIDFAFHQLSREVQDDHLIASIMMCRNESPNAEIALITSDAGLTLVAKARRLRIVTVRLPDT